jgi:hypothetical protein
LLSDNGFEHDSTDFYSSSISQSTRIILIKEIKSSLGILKNVFLSIVSSNIFYNHDSLKNTSNSVFDKKLINFYDIAKSLFSFSFALKKILIYASALFNSGKEKECFKYLFENGILEIEKNDENLDKNAQANNSLSPVEIFSSNSLDLSLQKNVIQDYSALTIALFFRLALPFLDSSVVGEFLGKKKDLNMKVLFSYANLGEYLTVTIDEIIRIIMYLIKIPGFF